MSEEDRASVWDVTRRVLYKGFVTLVSLDYSCYKLSGGVRAVRRHEVMSRADAVVVLAYDPRRHSVVLVEQYRSGPVVAADPSPRLLEVVAGMLDAGEAIEDAARRELQEETGLQALALYPIAHYWVTPGASTERIHAFCALVDSRGVLQYAGVDDENEDIRVRVYSYNEAWRRCVDVDGCTNSATLIAMQWLQRHVAMLQDAVMNMKGKENGDE